MEEFTFSVSDVLDYLGVQHARSGSRDTEDVVCPICKGKKLHDCLFQKSCTMQ